MSSRDTTNPLVAKAEQCFKVRKDTVGFEYIDSNHTGIDIYTLGFLDSVAWLSAKHRRDLEEIQNQLQSVRG